MRLTLERFKEKDGWILPGMEYVSVHVQFSEEEKEIIKASGVGDFIFFDVPKDEDDIRGDAYRPAITLDDLLKGKPINILPQHYKEAHYLELEEQVRGAARDTKAVLDDLKSKIENRTNTLDL